MLLSSADGVDVSDNLTIDNIVSKYINYDSMVVNAVKMFCLCFGRNGSIIAQRGHHVTCALIGPE